MALAGVALGLMVGCGGAIDPHEVHDVQGVRHGSASNAFGGIDDLRDETVDIAGQRVPASVAHASRVCVLRPERASGGVAMPIRDNGRVVGVTRGATFACWLALPGLHQITSIDDDTGPTILEARAGEHYFLHQEIAALDGTLHAHLDWVDDKTADSLLARCEARVHLRASARNGRDGQGGREGGAGGTMESETASGDPLAVVPSQ